MVLWDSLQDNLQGLGRVLGGPILGIDTSGVRTSFCCVSDLPPLVVEWTRDGKALPSDVLAQGISAEFESLGISPPSLRGIVIAIGPGSFTGIRVGLATAKGLALGANVGLYGVSSLAVLALSAARPWVGVCIDARHDEIYSGLYHVLDDGTFEVVVPDGTRTQEDFRQMILHETAERGVSHVHMVGDFASQWELEAPLKFRAEPGVFPRVGAAIWSQRARLEGGHSDSIETLSPRYFRLTAAERMQKAQLIHLR